VLPPLLEPLLLPELDPLELPLLLEPPLLEPELEPLPDELLLEPELLPLELLLEPLLEPLPLEPLLLEAEPELEPLLVTPASAVSPSAGAGRLAVPPYGPPSGSSAPPHPNRPTETAITPAIRPKRIASLLRPVPRQ
jgi:hypothetical protein